MVLSQQKKVKLSPVLLFQSVIKEVIISVIVLEVKVLLLTTNLLFNKALFHLQVNFISSPTSGSSQNQSKIILST
jgi:hypothetical protein